MSEMREMRFWGEWDQFRGGEFLDSDNNSKHFRLVTSSDPAYASLVSAVTPASTALNVTPAEFIEALKLFDPEPEPS